MATKNFVAGGVNYNWSYDAAGLVGSNWQTDGQPCTKPGIGDDVVFTVDSPNCIVDEAAVCQSFDSGGTSQYSGQITLTYGISVAGTVRFSATTTFTGAGDLTITAASTFTSNGTNLPGDLVLNTNGATVTLATNLTTINGTLTVASSCVLNAKNLAITGIEVAAGATLSGTTTIILGGGNIAVAGEVRNPLTLSGDITLIGNFQYRTGPLAYASGDVTTDDSALIITGTSTLNTLGVVWDKVEVQAGTCTLSSDLEYAGALNYASGVIFAGAGAPVPIDVPEVDVLSAYNMRKRGSYIFDTVAAVPIGNVYEANTVRGLIGRALAFDGNDDLVTIGDLAEDIHAIEILYMPFDITSWTDYLISLNGTDYVTVVNGVVTGNGFDGARVSVYVNGSMGTTLALNEWNHILITFNVGFEASAIEIGGIFETGSCKGIIDEVKLYTTQISNPDIDTIWETLAGRSVHTERCLYNPTYPSIPIQWSPGTTSVSIFRLSAPDGETRPKGLRCLKFAGGGTVTRKVDLDGIPARGYLTYDYYDGEWTTREGYITDPVEGVTYANQTLTFTGGAEDKITNINITFGGVA